MLTRAAWVVDERLTTDGAALLKDLGVEVLLADEGRYASWRGSLPGLTDTSQLIDGALPGGGAQRLMVIDPAMDLVDEAARSVNPVDDAVHLMAIASAMRYQLRPDRRSMVVTTTGLGIPAADVIEQLVPLVEGHEDFSFRLLDGITDAATGTNGFFVNGEPVTVEFDLIGSSTLADRLPMLDEAELRAVDTGSMLPVGDPRPAEWARRFRTALAVTIDTDEAQDVFDEVETELLDLRAAIKRPDSFRFTVGGSESPIPLRIENAGDTPLRVLVRIVSEKLVVPDGDVDVVLEPNTINEISVPVTARSNGVFPVSVELWTPAGNLIDEPLQLTARASSLAGLGRVVTVGALLVLVSWWFSYFRRSRRRRRAEDSVASQARHPASASVDAEADRADGSGEAAGDVGEAPEDDAAIRQ